MLPTRSVPRRRPRLWKRMGSWPIGRHWLPPFCVALAVYFGCSGVVARPSASSSEVGRPLIHNYSRRDFGAEVQQWDVAQDARGIMYFANNAGVIEFDGRNCG